MTSDRNTYFRPWIIAAPSCTSSWTKHKAMPVTGMTAKTERPSQQAEMENTEKNSI